MRLTHSFAIACLFLTIATMPGCRRVPPDGIALVGVRGPRLYSAGAMIDGLPTTYPDALGVNTPRDARKAVDRLVNSGADLIKVYTRVDPTLLKAVLDEARTFNMRVTGPLGLVD